MEARTYDLDEVRAEWSALKLPDDLTGKTFLDVGCWSAGFVREAINRGATWATGVDVVRCPKMHDVEFVQVDVMADAFLQLPPADVVLCAGVLYHIPDVVGLLRRLRIKTIEQLFIETACLPNDNPTPVMALFPDNPTNWFRPNRAMMHGLLAEAGFTSTCVYHKQTAPGFSRAAFACFPTAAGSRILPRLPREMQ